MLTTLTSLQLKEAATGAPLPVVAPPIVARAAPVAPPLDMLSPIPPEPAVATAPSYQFRGEGGTPFGAVPELYIQRPLIEYERNGRLLDGGDVTYIAPGHDAYNPPVSIAPPPVVRPRPGDAIIQLPPAVHPPAKPDIGLAVEPVTPPKPAEQPAGNGPVTGKAFGVDLSVVPFWAWIVGALLLGRRILA